MMGPDYLTENFSYRTCITNRDRIPCLGVYFFLSCFESSSSKNKTNRMTNCFSQNLLPGPGPQGFPTVFHRVKSTTKKKRITCKFGFL